MTIGESLLIVQIVDVACMDFVTQFLQRAVRFAAREDARVPLVLCSLPGIFLTLWGQPLIN